jgi:hypothetical protein
MRADYEIVRDVIFRAFKFIMKLYRLEVKKIWIYTSTSPYAFLACYLIS